MDPKLQIIFLGILLLAVIIGIAWALRTETRLKKFFLGKKAKDLEETILSMQDQIAKLETAKAKFEKEIAIIEAKLKKSIRGLETIRFNPFPDQGSNQSFAIGLLNEEGDGVVLSSLYSRERMSVFAKPIKKGDSTYELTAEEKDALERAKV
ncbi:MAG TPA: DUF4446 family protein [Candidatus Paceibacterota bacterium]|nr:DUF4446 family protein [Candidatus Paceibacterota bacterium]